MKSAFNLPPDWKERVQYSVDSFQRSTYQVPQQQPEHAVPTTRYGASQRMASKGIGEAVQLFNGQSSASSYDRPLSFCLSSCTSRYYSVLVLRFSGRLLVVNTLDCRARGSTLGDVDNSDQIPMSMVVAAQLAVYPQVTWIGNHLVKLSQTDKLTPDI